MPRKSKLESRKTRHRSLRKRIEGSTERPRLVVFRSTKHIYVQVVDDSTHNTLVAASDVAARKTDQADKSAPTKDAPAKASAGDKAAAKVGKKSERAKQVGVAIAKKCLEKGISRVVFDRAGFKYHGRVSAVAAGAREGGLEF